MNIKYKITLLLLLISNYKYGSDIWRNPLTPHEAYQCGKDLVDLEHAGPNEQKVIIDLDTIVIENPPSNCKPGTPTTITLYSDQNPRALTAEAENAFLSGLLTALQEQPGSIVIPVSSYSNAGNLKEKIEAIAREVEELPFITIVD